ncbi:MAG: helix-turn-helix transcriptional regulator [Planctomycetota bacterium]|jgi:AraC-like DNA-binding protein
MGIRFQRKMLYSSAILRVGDIRWMPEDGAASEEFTSPLSEITLQREGLFQKDQGRRRVACDPGTLVLFDHRETYRIRHPVRVPCACTALLLAPRTLGDIVRGLGTGVDVDRAADGRLTAALDSDQVPCDSEVTALHGALFAAARRGDDPLEVEELGLRIAGRVIGAALRDGGRVPRRRTARPGTSRAHADCVQAVRELLCARYRGRLTLGEIAASVHCAPTHLCELFKARTGLTIHRYLTRLRLAASLEPIAEERVPLARLAVDLGFSSHSHFTTSFRREFGLQPSRLRRRMGGRTLVRNRRS